MIELSGVAKRFGRVTAVADMTFSAPDGSITGLLGANGAGKTTTLKLIAGVLRPDRGEIRVLSARRANESASARNDIGALLDERGLYERLTARENLTYFARLHGLSKAHADRSVEQVIRELGLESLAERRTAGFSSGERMKVALARAIVHGPGNIVLDEPTNALDVATAKTLREMLRKQADSGACVMLSSHVLAEIESLCDRIIVVTDGAVAGCGSARELMAATGSATLEEAFLALTTNHRGDEKWAA